MKTKRKYIPANIRAGINAKNAALIIKPFQFKGSFSVSIKSFDHGRDVNGNGTAHYSCQLISASGEHMTGANDGAIITLVESGKRREQVGYGCGNEAALVALVKLGYQVDTSKASSDDYRGVAVYPLLNFPPVKTEV